MGSGESGSDSEEGGKALAGATVSSARGAAFEFHHTVVGPPFPLVVNQRLQFFTAGPSPQVI